MLLLCTHILSCITVGIILGKFSRKSDLEYRTRKSFNLYNNKNEKNQKINSRNKANGTSINQSTLPKANSSFKRNSQNISFKKKPQNISFKDLGEVLGNSINSSISTILLIGGFVVIFSVIISILNQTHTLDVLSKFLNPVLSILGFDLSFAKPLLSGIIELTNGVNLVADISIKAISQNIVLCAFLLGFGGLSVFLQVFSIVAKTDLSMKKYFVGKFLQGIFAAIYTFLALKFIPFINLDIVETSSKIAQTDINVLTQANNSLYSFFYDFGIFVIGIAIVFVIFRLFKKLYENVA